MTHFVKNLKTSAGPLILVADEDALVALLWHEEALKDIGLTKLRPGGSHDILDKAATQLQEYLEGERKRFDIPLRLDGTPFQQRVWKELQKIPYGKTISYQELAHRVGQPGASRAVGNANGKNPVSILVPCHRVVRQSGHLGGYAGGMDKKAFLLELEGHIQPSLAL